MICNQFVSHFDITGSCDRGENIRGTDQPADDSDGV